MASLYAKFAFWRAIQYRHGRLSNIQQIPSDAADEEREVVNESKSPNSEEMNNTWDTRHRNHILTGAFLCLITLSAGSIAARLIASWSGYAGWQLRYGSESFLASGLV